MLVFLPIPSLTLHWSCHRRFAMHTGIAETSRRKQALLDSKLAAVAVGNRSTKIVPRESAVVAGAMYESEGYPLLLAASTNFQIQQPFDILQGADAQFPPEGTELKKIHHCFLPIWKDHREPSHPSALVAQTVWFRVDSLIRC